MKFLVPILALVFLTACTTAGVGGAVTAEGSKLTQAATTPLSDLNIVKTEIAPVLLTAQRGPYAVPADRSCSALTSELQALDAALGPDLDAPVKPSKPSLVEKGVGVVGDAAAQTIRGAAVGAMPFREWVRKLSGAEGHSSDLAAAMAAGTLRRAYLKGMGQSANCPPPVVPPSS